MDRYFAVSDQDSAFYDEYFRSGDVGNLDDDGFLHLVGRLSELINVGGKKVMPAEIEEALCSIENISEAACVARADPQEVLGEVVAAYVVAQQGMSTLSKNEVNSLVKDKLQSYMLPAEIHWVDSIPKTAAGKIKRFALKEAHEVNSIG